MSNATGGVLALLKLEALAVTATAALLYNHFNFSWATFLIFFLLPDISLLAFLISAKVGALFYNATHSYIGVFVLLAIGLYVENSTLMQASLIWSTHIGFDRLLGYGLKYNSGFHNTHLGMIGQKNRNI